VKSLLVDGRPLSPAFSSSGSGSYLRGLLPALVGLGELEVSALVTKGTGLPTGVIPVEVDRRLPEQLRYFEQLVRLPGDIRRSGPAVFHSPATDPPSRCGVPFVQTLLDLIPLLFDAPVFRLERRLWRARARRIRRADAVIAISRHTAALGIERLGLDPARVEVVHLGVDPDFTPPERRLHAEPGYVLCVSNLAPHKGYREAFGVASSLADAGLSHRLKMVGGVWASESHRVRAALSASGQANRVDMLGRVSRVELVRLYQQADAVIVTSRHEGFGLPAIEAMATGTPLVAFANTSLPEIIDDGGILVPDGDVGAMATAVRALLEDPTRWQELSEAGLSRGRQFDWIRCAREHQEIFAGAMRER
jgi:alpha-1,3-rhamnosyl/mannosyltransferase